jgi:hypothetical protein
LYKQFFTSGFMEGYWMALVTLFERNGKKKMARSLDINGWHALYEWLCDGEMHAGHLISYWSTRRLLFASPSSQHPRA